jgi:two-component system response regulator FixJ
MTYSPVVHVIDDDDDVRSSIAFLLTSAGFAVQLHESADAFLDALPNLQSGCVVSDVRMPGMDGLTLLRRLAVMRPRFPAIVMTGHADVPLAVEAMKAGAVDFIEKPFEASVMLGALRQALEWHDQGQAAAARLALIENRLRLLSPREREVLERVTQGKPNKIIAYELGLSARTVEVYRANVMNKMGAESLSELVRMVLATDQPPPDSRRPGG